MPRILAVLLVLLAVPTVQAEELIVAVAANFTAPAKEIAARFDAASGHKTVLSFGSTGAFYAQIRNGAPFQILLSADDETPARLEKEGAAVAGSRFTYAVGTLVLWSAREGVADADGAVLGKGAFDRIAIANPKVAPYGAAAQEAIRALGLTAAIEPKLVFGENITQAYQFVATGSAPLGFVAMSQVYENGKLKSGSAWVVPQKLYGEIKQDAVLLNAGKGKAAAEAFLQFLRGPQARKIIESFGYR